MDGEAVLKRGHKTSETLKRKVDHPQHQLTSFVGQALHLPVLLHIQRGLRIGADDDEDDDDDDDNDRADGPEPSATFHPTSLCCSQLSSGLPKTGQGPV